MSDNTLSKAVIISGAMIALAIASGHLGFGGFIWGLLGVGAGCYLAWREIWKGEMPDLGGNDDEPEDPVADRFR